MAESFSLTISRYDLGHAGWRRLHELAHRRGRKPRDQVIALVLFALDQDSVGENVELSQHQLDALFEDETERVA